MEQLWEQCVEDAAKTGTRPLVLFKQRGGIDMMIAGVQAAEQSIPRTIGTLNLDIPLVHKLIGSNTKQ